MSTYVVNAMAGKTLYNMVGRAENRIDPDTYCVAWSTDWCLWFGLKEMVCTVDSALYIQVNLDDLESNNRRSLFLLLAHAFMKGMTPLRSFYP